MIYEKETEMQSPWVCWANDVRELFKQDPEIKMTWSDKTLELHIYVKGNAVKRAAIRELLPEVKEFVKVKVKVFVEDEPGRRGGSQYTPELIEAAFKGNPLYHYLHVWDDPEETSTPYCWVEMAKEVIQYPNDDLSALYGDRSCLPADLAKEVLGEYTQYIYYDTINPKRDPVPTDPKGNPVK